MALFVKRIKLELKI